MKTFPEFLKVGISDKSAAMQLKTKSVEKQDD
jgi:hypothetical protein